MWNGWIRMAKSHEGNVMQYVPVFTPILQEWLFIALHLSLKIKHWEVRRTMVYT